jgi:hypothetical protein
MLYCSLSSEPHVIDGREVASETKGRLSVCLKDARLYPPVHALTNSHPLSDLKAVATRRWFLPCIISGLGNTDTSAAELHGLSEVGGVTVAERAARRRTEHSVGDYCLGWSLLRPCR